MAEEGASVPDKDDSLAESGFEVTPEPNFKKKKRKKKAKGKKNPRRPSKKQPIDSRPRGPKEVEEPATVPEEEEESVSNGNIYDDYLNNQVMLKTGDRMLKCVVVNQTHDLKNTPIGQRNNNPLLDTRICDLRLPDGQIDQHTANTIAECIYSDIDEEGHVFTMMNDLFSHKKDDTALTKDEASYFTTSGQLQNKPTTKGWKIEVD